MIQQEVSFCGTNGGFVERQNQSSVACGIYQNSKSPQKCNATLQLIIAIEQN